MANLRWLTPGLGIKRWVLLICISMVLLILGAILVGLGLFNINPTGTEQIPVSPYGVGGFLIGLSFICVFISIYRLARRIESLIKPSNENRGLTELALLRSRLEQGARIVCLGGGTGLNCLLSGIRDHSSDITAVVSVADDGGSSGRLRSEFGLLPPGDIRNCLSALADSGPIMSELMQYRFSEGEFSGHSFGNLLIMVLTKIKGSFGSAVREANRILNVRGRVLPATLDHVTLVASHEDGTKTTGQKRIAECGKPILGLELRPSAGQTPPDVISRIQDADLIIIGPGSLYTSIIPNLLAPDVVKAISSSRARVTLVVNTVEDRGETKGYKVSNYIKAIKRLAPGLRLDMALVNSFHPSQEKVDALADKGIGLTELDPENCKEFGTRIRRRDVIDIDNPERHDPQKLAIALMEDFEAQTGVNI